MKNIGNFIIGLLILKNNFTTMRIHHFTWLISRFSKKKKKKI